MSLVSRLRNVRLDVLAAVLGLLLALLLFPLRFLASQIYIETLPIVLGTASGLYLLAAWTDDTTSGLPRLSNAFSRLAPSVVFFGMALMVVVATLADGRTIHFYDIGGVVGTVLLAQIILSREENLVPGLVLGQVLVFAFIVRFAALFNAPGVIGIDAWTHMRFIENIAAQESLSAFADRKYYASPLFHLLTVAAAGLFDVSLREGLYLSVGVVMPIATLFIYTTGRLLVGQRWSMVAATLYAVGDHVVRWGIHLIPTSLGLVFFLGIIYSLTRVFRTDYRARDFFLLVFFSVGVILTHQISSFIMLVLVGAGLLAQVVVRFDFLTSPETSGPFMQRLPEPVNLFGLLVFDLGLITFMWSLTPYKGDTFLQTVLNYFRNTLTESAGFLNLAGGDEGAEAAAAGGQGPSLLAEVATYLDTLGFLLLLFATVVGCLVVLNRRRSGQATFTYLGVVVVMLVFVLGLPLFGIRNFVPGRWFAFLYAPMVVLGAIGLRHLSQNLSPRVAGVVIVLFILVTPSLMLMSANGTPDSPVLPSERARYEYTEQELAAVETIDRTVPVQDEPIYTDHPYQTVFDREGNRTGTMRAEATGVRDGRPVVNDTVVYREYQSDGGSYFSIPGGGRIYDFPRSQLCPETMNHVYANGQVRMCVTPGGG